MTEQYKRIRRTVAALGIGLILGVGVFIWTTQLPSLREQQTYTDSRNDQRLVKLEQAVMALTQAMQSGQMKTASSGPTQGSVPATSEVSRQDLVRVIRDEVHHAMAQENPEAQRAREEAIAEAQMLNSPENHAAYQSASSVVNTAVAAKRWTEEDKETFSTAFGQLTNDQRMELMNILAPAINNGEIEVEVTGPLF